MLIVGQFYKQNYKGSMKKELMRNNTLFTIKEEENIRKITALNTLLDTSIEDHIDIDGSELTGKNLVGLFIFKCFYVKFQHRL